MDLKRLRSAYDVTSGGLYLEPEPFESVELVERYRQYWKPKNVRIILLAESHVYTSDQDRRQKMKEIDGAQGAPREYAKLVYCLGYGESSLTDGDFHPLNDGTPQFWKLFYSCINPIESNKDFAPLLKSKTTTLQRIRSKITLLNVLRESGIWLVDASVVALYHGGIKPDMEQLGTAVRASWDIYTKDIVAECNPEHVIVVGRTVGRALSDDLTNTFRGRYTVLAQPNARLTAAQHMNNYQTYYKICAGIQS